MTNNLESKIEFFLDNDKWFQGNDPDVWMEGPSRAVLRKILVEFISTSAMFAKVMVLKDDLINLLKEYSTSNWDEDGADSISDESWNTAFDYLVSIARVPGFPDVTVDRRGKVCLQWGSVFSKYFLVKFGAFGSCSCFLKNDAINKPIVNKHNSLSEGENFLCRIQHQ